jgi:hypothetical protein
VYKPCEPFRGQIALYAASVLVCSGESFKGEHRWDYFTIASSKAMATGMSHRLNAINLL